MGGGCLGAYVFCRRFCLRVSIGNVSEAMAHILYTFLFVPVYTFC